MKLTLLASALCLLGLAGFMWMSAPGSSTVSCAAAITKSDSIDWKSMDHDSRKAYMRQVVMPAMRTAFAAFDSVKFGNMKCGVCHGDGARDDSFKMPNPKIFKLPNSREGWAKADPKFMKFMKETVKPKMAAMLGMPEFNMQTKAGFGCGNCHTDQM